VPRYAPQKVGVLGAGLMGSGIAYSQANRGIASVLKDVTIEKAEKGKAYSAAISQKMLEAGRITTVQQATLLNLIQATDNAQDLKGCDLIIEAVFEQRDLKAAVTQEAQTMLAEGGFFASNTSTLPISGLATASHYPEKFVGIHFFSPV
jgi:3-hydroxyacyl-CoA dehydrogenase/enoyl-CoA hydratase/3-hydroxybutyryl-CoA epimerase